MKNLKIETSTKGYIWFNPDKGIYQNGTKEEYSICYAKSKQRELCSLILELVNGSDLLEDKLVKELNAASDHMVQSQLKVVC